MADPSARKATIYHNPRCSKSRRTLALLEERGVQVEVVEYLKSPPDAATLRAVLGMLGMPASEIVRGQEQRKLGLAELDDEDSLIEQMVSNPAIIQRPIVVVGGQARIGRPPENVLEIL